MRVMSVNLIGREYFEETVSHLFDFSFSQVSLIFRTVIFGKILRKSGKCRENLKNGKTIFSK